MQERGLSSKEERQLLNRCIVPTLIVVFVFIVYFIYLQRIAALSTLQDFVIRFFMPFVTLGSSVFAVSFELFYHQKTGKPVQSHLKRLSMNMSLILACTLSFAALMLLADTFLAPRLGAKMSVAFASVLWTVAFAIIVLRYQKFFGKFFG
jgi:hypothetical protein